MSQRRYADLVQHFRETGQLAAEAQRIKDAAFADRLRVRDPQAYARLLSQFFHAVTHAVARLFPDAPTGRDIYALIDQGDADAVMRAIAFLDADPRFFRSGYLKSALIVRLKRARLTEVDCSMLRRIVLQAVAPPGTSPLKAYIRLAVRVANDDLVTQLSGLHAHPDPNVRGRARAMLTALASPRPPNKPTKAKREPRCP
jgi:hypothetical protein